MYQQRSVYDSVRVTDLLARGSDKWTKYSDDVPAAWVAELDFPLAPPFQEALDKAHFGIAAPRRQPPTLRRPAARMPAPALPAPAPANGTRSAAPPPPADSATAPPPAPDS